jgi:hypothetical protein
MPIEAALIKPLVDALLALFRQAGDIKLKRQAEIAVREAIHELLRANPDENGAAARIAVAKAAGILSGDVVLAEDMLRKHRATKARTTGKSATGRRRRRPETPPDGEPGGTTGTEAAPARKVAIAGKGARPAAAARLAARRAPAATEPPRVPCPPCPAPEGEGTDPRRGR